MVPVRKQRLEVTGEYIHSKEIVSTVICLTAVIEGKGHNRSRPVASFAIRQEWWTDEALPEATVVRREVAGVAKVEVVGRSKVKVEEIFWDTVTQVRADLAGIRRKLFPRFRAANG